MTAQPVAQEGTNLPKILHVEVTNLETVILNLTVNSWTKKAKQNKTFFLTANTL